MIARAIILWFAIFVLAVLNGAFREKALRPRLGQRVANTLSGLLLIALVAGFTIATIGWLPRTHEPGFLLVGAAWLAATVALEFAFGRFVARASWRDLIGAYRFRDGNLWPVVLLAMALMPWIAALVRGCPLTG